MYIRTRFYVMCRKIRYQLKLLPHRPRMFWHRLWVRKDEFHKSLETDVRALSLMNAGDADRYAAGLARRRKIAHDRKRQRVASVKTSGAGHKGRKR